jgi:hypothetical protein
LVALLRTVTSRASPGTAAKSGAAGAPHTTVSRAPGWRSISQASRPVERIASPIRVEVMNRIFTAPGSIVWAQ